VTTTQARYEDWLASIGNPDHHVLIGPDWWLCLCGRMAGPDWGAPAAAEGCAAGLGTPTATIGHTWTDIVAISGTVADVHQALWEAEAF
jgi:hypothetical protein